MTNFAFSRNRFTVGGTALFFFAMVYLARDTLVTSSLLGFTRAQLLLLALVGLAGVVFLVYNRRKFRAIVTDPRMAVALTAVLVVLLPMVWKQDWQMMYFSILLGPLLGVFLSYSLTCQEAAKYYVSIMAALGAYSVLALWVLRPALVDTGLWTPPVFQNQIDVPFYNFGLSFVSEWYVRTRNFGIFREPGVYQYFLILALYLNNFWVEWRKDRSLWFCNLILAVTAVSTLSTAGVAALVLLAAAVFWERKLYRNKWVWLGLALLAGGLALGWVVISREKGELYWELYSMVVGKFQPGEDSGVERLDAVLTDLQLFFRSPVVGQRLSDVLHAVENNTASTPILFAGLGVLGGCFHCFGWLCLAARGRGGLWGKAVSLAALALSFNTQNLSADVFLWLFPVMAMTQWIVTKWSGRKGVCGNGPGAA